MARETFYVLKRRRDGGDHPDAQAVSHFGPKKVRAKLMAEHPGIAWPASSTIGDILKNAGLVEARPRRRRPVGQGKIAAGASAANDEWAIDFKGWLRTRDGTHCDPLTVSDTASRYLIEVRITDPTFAGVKARLERVFADIGLPQAIRSDNGAPFGSIGAGGLSRLSVWLLKLSINVRHIRPASPQDNGRHERMHRTLKAETVHPPATDWIEQQLHYNVERPHEALRQMTPASLWQPPERQLPKVIEPPWYDADHQVRKVRPTGEIKWRGGYIFIGEALAREPIGILKIDDGIHLVRFCGRHLGTINHTGRFHRFAPPHARLRCTMEPNQTNKE